MAYLMIAWVLPLLLLLMLTVLPHAALLRAPAKWRRFSRWIVPACVAVYWLYASYRNLRIMLNDPDPLPHMGYALPLLILLLSELVLWCVTRHYQDDCTKA